MKKIGFVNDLAPNARAGGANRAISLYLEEEPDGVEVQFCTPGDFDKECDSYVVFLAKRFTDEQLSHVISKPYVWCGFDWWVDEDGNSKWRNLLPSASKLAMFVSPLHERRYTSLYGVRCLSTLVLPPPLDLSRLSAVQTPSTREGAVWAAEWHAAKGPDLAATLARKLEIHMDMYSPSMPAEVARARNAFTPFAHPKGFVQEEEWYETLARYETLIHTPRVPDAFGYITLEAYALGLKVILAGATGVESYEMPFGKLLEECGSSARRFWEAVEAVL